MTPDPQTRPFGDALPVVGADALAHGLTKEEGHDRGVVGGVADEAESALPDEHPVADRQQGATQRRGVTEVEAGQQAAGDDPDGDGLMNVVEFAMGTNPTNNAAGEAPVFVTQIVNGISYPAIQFTRNRSATGVTIQCVASSEATFVTLAPTVQTSVDLGNGLDLVTVHTTSPMSSTLAMFLKAIVSQP